MAAGTGRARARCDRAGAMSANVDSEDAAICPLAQCEPTLTFLSEMANTQKAALAGIFCVLRVNDSNRAGISCIYG